jgi:hypothetical protein
MTWTDLSKAAAGVSPAVRNAHGFTTVGGRLYVHGGYGSKGEECLCCVGGGEVWVTGVDGVGQDRLMLCALLSP